MTAKLFKLLFLLTFFTCCQSARHGITLSKFTVNGKNYNSLIIDRVPDYGDGRKDGCIVEGQIYLSLVSGDSDSGIEGTVKDVKDNSPLSGATVAISQSTGDLTELIQTDSVGRFSYSSSAGGIESIQVNFIGYRTLDIDLSKKRLFK